MVGTHREGGGIDGIHCLFFLSIRLGINYICSVFVCKDGEYHSAGEGSGLLDRWILLAVSRDTLCAASMARQLQKACVGSVRCRWRVLSPLRYLEREVSIRVSETEMKLEIKKIEKCKALPKYDSKHIPLRPALVLAFFGARVSLSTDTSWELEVKSDFRGLVSLSQTADPHEMKKVLFTDYMNCIHFRHRVSKMKMALSGVRNPTFTLVDCERNDSFCDGIAVYMLAAMLEVEQYTEFRKRVTALQELVVDL